MTVTFSYPEMPFSSHAETVGGHSHLFLFCFGFPVVASLRASGALTRGGLTVKPGRTDRENYTGCARFGSS